MALWFSKRLGHGSQAYTALRELRRLRFALDIQCPQPYQLTVDTDTADTVVFLPAEHASLARAFHAIPCAYGPGDDPRFKNLGFEAAEADTLFSAYPPINLELETRFERSDR